MNFLKHNFKSLLLWTVLFLAVFFVTPYLSGLADGTNGARLEAAYVQRLAFGVLLATLVQVAKWGIIHLDHPTTRDYMDTRGFKDDFECHLTAWQRVKATILILSLVTFSILTCLALALLS